MSVHRQNGLDSELAARGGAAEEKPRQLWSWACKKDGRLTPGPPARLPGGAPVSLAQ